jgi:hypothetical protein
MPKHATQAEHFKAKWQGQLARCKQQAEEIQALNVTVESWKKDFLDKHAQYCSRNHEIGLLRVRIKELEDTLSKVVDKDFGYH